MSTFRRRSVESEVDARQVTETTAEQIAEWCGGFLVTEINSLEPDVRTPGINVPTARGSLRASTGSYVVRDRSGDFTVYHEGSFHREFVEEEAPKPSFNQVPPHRVI